MTDAITTHVLDEVAREIFGSASRIESTEPMGVVQEHGLEKRPSPTRNACYRVRVTGVSPDLVFRFHRGRGEDRYEQEVHNYRLVGEATGIRTPTIFGMDRSRSTAPAPYIVMEYLEGDPWQYLIHPDNPETSAAAKRELARNVGSVYARAHSVLAPADRHGSEALQLSYSFDRLKDAVERREFEADAGLADRCREAVLGQPMLHAEELSLCLADSEIYFTREGADWVPAFICDVEWVEFRDYCSDMVHVIPEHRALWEVHEAIVLHAEDLSALPLMQGYEAVRPIEYHKLTTLLPYYQLAFWANLMSEASSPDKREWIRQSRGSLIRELMHVVADSPGVYA